MEKNILKVSQKDFELIEKLTSNPPAPNEALRELVRKHSKKN